MNNSYAPRDRFFYVTLLIFLLIYSSVSLVNHYLFRTYAFDLGIINNSIYDYSLFRANNCMLMQPQFDNLLSDHFTLLPVIISPLRFIFGTYTLLIFQIVMILVGGTGIYRLIYLRTADLLLSRIAMLHFFLIWGVISALAFDYHDNVIAAMLVPFIFLFAESAKPWQFFLTLCLIVISKENMALWASFICAGMFFLYAKGSEQRRLAVYGTIMSFAMFVIIVKFIMPSLANEGRPYLHFKYTVLGVNASEAPGAILTRPLEIIKSFFVNIPRYSSAYGIKPELHLVVLLSGGLLLFYQPVFFFMLFPVYAQKLLNDDFTKWGLNQHYSIEFVPILCIGAFTVINKIAGSQRNKHFLAYGVLLSTLIITAVKSEHRTSKWYIKENTAFYQPRHWKQEFDVKELYDLLQSVPDNAAVSASSVIVPHLALRETIYQFPVINDAGYIVILFKGTKYPLTDSEFDDQLNRLKSDSNWQIIKINKDACIFKRITQQN